MSATITRRHADWRQGWILVLAGFLPIVAIIGLTPALPTLIGHFKNDIDNPRFWVPLLVTAPSACIALLGPVAGFITDKLGRRRLMLAGMLLYGCGGLVPFVVDSFALVVAGRVLIGIAEAAILTVTNTLLADYFDDQTRRRWLTVQAVAGSLLGSGLLVLSGWLASHGWQWPFAVYGVALPLFVCAWFWLYEPEKREDPAAAAAEAAAARPEPANAGERAFPIATMAIVCAVTLLLATIYFVQIINFSLVLKEMGVDDPRSIGLISAVPSFGVPLGGLLFYATGRFGPVTQLMLTFICYAVGLGGIGLAGSVEQAMGFAFIQQTGSGIVISALIAWAQSKLAFEHRGRGMGMWVSAFFAGQFVSPAVVAMVASQIGGLKPAFVAFGALSLACAVVALLRRGGASQGQAAAPHHA
ncbi:MFS transporter [Ramlibacter albus]|uniref:MFS transporter n=1 Tax=Ramlibacter albus TaxID=2079448 RepID=A0A923MC91_9BURK|nr:MFS transporter [Ramlibacter albus]MBC5766753.1 MFS transporter [Ramlibacter albus]